MSEVRFITLDPAHFHAALVQKDQYEGVSRRVHVYAPLGPDLLAHLGRIAGFNLRSSSPTAWELEVHAGNDFLQRMLQERPGNAVILSGRNHQKIRYIQAAVEAGLHVLADKPWILKPADLPALAAMLDQAEARRLVAFDIMTERFEITSLLQRELVQDRAVFGEPIRGTPQEPGVSMESMHYLMKQVAGVPNRRPAAFFDVEQQGEGLTDVGTHLVDLAQWILFPGQSIDAPGDVAVLDAKRWPTLISRTDFQRMTGDADFPDYLHGSIRDERLHYFCNTQVTYCLRGIHVKLDVLWDFEARDGAGDTHFAVFRGSRSCVEVRQGREQNYRPEVYVVPNPGADLETALRSRMLALQARFPGVGLAAVDGGWQITIPNVYRVGHEAHFAEVTRTFLGYLRDPGSLPAWEKSNMLAKYRVTTEGVARARSGA